MINVFLLYDKFNIVNPFCVSVCLADSNTKFFWVFLIQLIFYLIKLNGVGQQVQVILTFSLHQGQN